jgi:hypothetical protein
VFSWSDSTLDIGKDAQRELRVFANVPYDYRELIKSLATSNEVYLYTGEKGQTATANNWLEVRSML